MNRMLAVGAAALCLALVHSTVADALPRGSSGTKTRKAYCQDKYDTCVQDARKDCKVTVPISYDSSICLLGAMNACDRSWGSKSTCNSEPLVVNPSTLGKKPPALLRAP